MRDITTATTAKPRKSSNTIVGDAKRNLVNVTQAALICNVSRTNMYYYFSNGEIPSTTIRHSRYATLEDVQAFAVKCSLARVTWRQDCTITGVITSITPSKIFLLSDNIFYKINLNNLSNLTGMPFDFLNEGMTVIVTPIMVNGFKMINFSMLGGE